MRVRKIGTRVGQTYGSMDQFLTTEMELTPEKLTMLRTKYLQ